MRYYDSDSDYSEVNRDDIPRSRRKSVGREIIDRLGGAIGLRAGSAGPESRRHSFTDAYAKRRSYSLSPPPAGRRHRDRRRVPRQPGRVAQAVEAAIDAGAVAACRLRRVPGQWIGEKGTKVA